MLAKVYSKGRHKGWGATCNCHSGTLECKKSLQMPNEEGRLRILGWLIEGIKIPPETDRARHVHKVNPRKLTLKTEARLKQLALLRYP